MFEYGLFQMRDRLHLTAEIIALSIFAALIAAVFYSLAL
jgi:hypothetical protein